MAERNGAITLTFDVYEIDNICDLLKRELWAEEPKGADIFDENGHKVYGRYGPLRKPTKRYRQLQFTLNSIKRQIGEEEK